MEEKNSLRPIKAASGTFRKLWALDQSKVRDMKAFQLTFSFGNVSFHF